MTGPLDPLDRLRQPVDPLAPPVGTFDRLLDRARRRRRARTAIAATLSAALLAGGAGLARSIAEGSDGNQRLLPPAAGDGHSTGPSRHPSAPPTASRPTRTEPRTAGPSTMSLPDGPVPGGFQPYSVTAVAGGRVLYLLGDAPCPRPVCTSVLRSVDGGLHWRGVPAPVAPLPPPGAAASAPAASVRDLRFATSSDGWAFGGALYSTHDAGGHWGRVDVGGSVLDLATDGRMTYAVVASCDTAGQSCRGARLRSTAARRDRWQDVPGVRGGDAGAIVLVGSSGHVTLDSGGTTLLWSLQPGQSWRRVTAPPCPTGLAALTGALTGSRLVAACGEGAAGSRYLTTYVSDDDGGTWTRQPGTALRLTFGWLSLAAATPDTLLAASGSPDLGGRLARSTDGGRSWSQPSTPQSATGWRYVGARDPANLVALPLRPDAVLWTSADAGATWTAHRFR